MFRAVCLKVTKFSCTPSLFTILDPINAAHRELTGNLTMLHCESLDLNSSSKSWALARVCGSKESSSTIDYHGFDIGSIFK